MPLLKPGLVPCLTQGVIDKLRKSKIVSAMDFVISPTEFLESDSSLTLKEINVIKQTLVSHYSVFPINGADAVDEMIGSHAILGTGCSRIDEILEGGLYTNEITEICGPPASGKTQIALFATQNVGCMGRYSVLYIDTSSGFNGNRLLEICTSKGASAETIKEFEQSVRHCFVSNLFHVFTLLESTANSVKMQKDHFHRRLKLIIIDSITFLFAPFLGGTQTDVCGLMVQLAYHLKSLSVDCKLAVLITNNTVQGDGGRTKPALGSYWQYVPNARLMISIPSSSRGEKDGLSKSFDTCQKITVIKSTKKACGNEIFIKITSNGIENRD